MSWKSKIKVQLQVASKKRAISSNLKDLVNDLLKGDTEFQLVYSSSREQYMSVRFKDGKVSKKTKAIILNEYGIRVWKVIKPREYEYAD